MRALYGVCYSVCVPHAHIVCNKHARYCLLEPSVMPAAMMGLPRGTHIPYHSDSLELSLFGHMWN